MSFRVSWNRSSSVLDWPAITDLPGCVVSVTPDLLGLFRCADCDPRTGYLALSFLFLRPQVAQIGRCLRPAITAPIARAYGTPRAVACRLGSDSPARCDSAARCAVAARASGSQTKPARSGR